MSKMHNIGDLRSRQLSIKLKAVADSENKFEISISSETVDIVFGEREYMLHETEAIDLERANSGLVPILFAHGRDGNTGRMPIGGIEKVWLDQTERKLRALIEMDADDDEAMKICRKMNKGYLNGISVGARVQQWLWVEAGQTAYERFEGPCWVAEKWELLEASIEPIPADTTVGIGRSALKQQEQPEIAEIEKEIERTMTEEEIRENERKKNTDIFAICKRFNVDPAEYITKGVAVEDVTKDILDKLEKAQKPVASINLSGIEVGESGEDKYRSAVTDGLIMRSGIKLEKTADGANDFRGMRLKDVAVDCLTRAGVANAHRMSDEQLLQKALSPASAFSSILDATVNKVMGVSYAGAPSTYQEWVGIGTNTDFKPKKIVRISEAGDLSEIKENGEITFDEVNDEGVSSTLLTFGKRFGFTRQSLINDDLDMLTRVPQAYMRAARRGINKAVYKLLTSNPTLQDGAALFSTTHKNISASGAKPCTDSYNEAYAAMMCQTNLKGIEKLNIRPSFVLSAPELFANHASMLQSTADPSSNNSGRFNAFANSMILIIDAELSRASGALPYYFAANAMDCDTVEVSYLNGNDMPILESKVGFDFCGIEYRIIMDYGVTLVDHRGFYKNIGL